MSAAPVINGRRSKLSDDKAREIRTKRVLIELSDSYCQYIGILLLLLLYSVHSIQSTYIGVSILYVYNGSDRH